MAKDRTKQLREEHAVRTLRRLKGRTIVNARYMTEDEITAQAWHRGAVVLELDDGSLLTPQSDDEGNDPGALRHVTDRDEFIMPVI